MADTRIDISNRALVMIGAGKITSFTDGSTEAEAVSEVYEDVVTDGLTSHPWRFATKQAVLSRLAAEPTGRYDAQYQVPSDSLILQTVTLNDYPIEYQIYEDKILNNATVNDELIADYLYRPNEQFWPPNFRLAITYFLASVIAGTFDRPELVQVYEEKSNLKMAIARSRDSQASGRTKKIRLNKLTGVRL